MWAFFFMSCAALLYRELVKLEAIGARTGVYWIHVAHKIGGVWGATSVFIFLGIACLYSGLKILRKQA